MKTQYIKLIIYILLGFANLTAKGQIIIDTLTSQYYNEFNKATQIIEEITITNNSEEDYLTWISQFPISEKPNNVIIQRFFFSRHGDFRFFDLMYNNVSFAHGIPHNVPFSFIKKIKKNESFTYILLKENKESNFYDERIVVISRKEVEDYLKVKIREEFFYPQPSIFLYDKPTGKDNFKRDTSSQLTDQSNQLNWFILESVCSFVKDYNAFAKQVNHDTIRYVWSNGLPDYFPCDSLPCEVFYIAKMEGERSQKKEFKHFVKVAEITTTLNGNTIEVLVSVNEIKRLRKNHLQIARTEDCMYYYYDYNCETSNWQRVIKCVYSDVTTHSFVCLQNDSISVYYKTPNMDKPSCFYGTYQCTNDTLCLSDNLLKDGMKQDEYLFVLDSTHRTLSVTPYYSTTNEAIPKNSTNKKKMMLGRRFKNTSCFEELKRIR